MTDALRHMRSRILTPSFAEATIARRGFHEKDGKSREHLERIGRTFLTGYAHAARAAAPDDVEPVLREVPVRYRGFAFEGAAMGHAVVDALSWHNGHRSAGYLAGCGAPHAYMVHVGLGWALARLPRLRRPRAVVDPLFHWLVLDGYGFHEAYFRTDRTVRQRIRVRTPAWGAEDTAWYRSRAVDQGIGRALWFTGGTAPDVVADLLEAFEPARRPDLWSGVGLAATYAGGASEAELVLLRRRAGHHLPQLAQGACFAAEARRTAGLQVPETDAATGVLCQLPASDAAEVARATRPAHDAGPPGLPAYEVWRQRIAEQFVSLGRI